MRLDSYFHEEKRIFLEKKTIEMKCYEQVFSKNSSPVYYFCQFLS